MGVFPGNNNKWHGNYVAMDGFDIIAGSAVDDSSPTDAVNVIIMDISDESCDTDVDVFFGGENEVTAVSFADYAEEEDQVASGR